MTDQAAGAITCRQVPFHRQVRVYRAPGGACARVQAGRWIPPPPDGKGGRGQGAKARGQSRPPSWETSAGGAGRNSHA